LNVLKFLISKLLLWLQVLSGLQAQPTLSYLHLAYLWPLRPKLRRQRDLFSDHCTANGWKELLKAEMSEGGTMKDPTADHGVQPMIASELRKPFTIADD
jgi:hypothetical protein